MNGKEQPTANYKNIPTHFLTNPHYRIFRHLLLLLTILLLAAQNFSKDPLDHKLLNVSLIFLIISGIVYLNLYVLSPKLLFRNKIGSYFAWICGTVFIVILLLILVQYYTIPEEERSKHLQGLWFLLLNVSSIMIQIVLIITGTSAILLFQRWAIHEQRISLLENATMQSELEQLKNQINPHFLFNMLNNANELTHENSDEAARIIDKLNDLLKYQLSDSVKDFVLLEADIQFLTDFLNLEKIRRDHFEFTVSTQGDISGLTVPPLLFIPFVENAVKHGNDKNSYIHLSFKVENNGLYFTCINSKPKENKHTSDRGGLGLSNIKRRLELLFGQDYSLDISENELTYNVKLYLNYEVCHC